MRKVTSVFLGHPAFTEVYDENCSRIFLKQSCKVSHFKECRIIIDNRGIYMASGTCMKGQASSMISTFGSETKG